MMSKIFMSLIFLYIFQKSTQLSFVTTTTDYINFWISCTICPLKANRRVQELEQVSFRHVIPIFLHHHRIP